MASLLFRDHFILVTLSKAHCSRCLLRQDLCLCRQAPRLSDTIEDVHLLLLTHTDELRKASNTGRLLESALPKCELWQWQRTEFEARWQRFLQSQTRAPILLFPTDEHFASPLVPLHGLQSISEKHAFATSHVFVLIDATWQQARKILKKSPSLQNCPRLSLSFAQKSQYTLRRNQSTGNYSTVESGCGLLRELAFEADAELVDRYFKQFLRHSEAHRSGYALTRGGDGGDC